MMTRPNQNDGEEGRQTWKRSAVVEARKGAGTDPSGFDSSLKHCSDCVAVISLTVPLSSPPGRNEVF